MISRVVVSISLASRLQHNPWERHGRARPNRTRKDSHSRLGPRHISPRRTFPDIQQPVALLRRSRDTGPSFFRSGWQHCGTAPPSAAVPRQVPSLDPWHVRSQAQATPATRREAIIWLHGERSVSLRLFHHHTRACWQLQHGCALAFAQMRQQDDFPVGELKRVVMDV